jgi:hypothetical protein
MHRICFVDRVWSRVLEGDKDVAYGLIKYNIQINRGKKKKWNTQQKKPTAAEACSRGGSGGGN